MRHAVGCVCGDGWKENGLVDGCCGVCGVDAKLGMLCSCFEGVDGEGVMVVFFFWKVDFFGRGLWAGWVL